MEQSNHTVSLADLGVTEDPGTAWHPRPDKTEVRDDAGCLRDLNDDEVVEHCAKPEAAEQIDAGRILSAEDSAETSEDEV